jgi:hypothetical protein
MSYRGFLSELLMAEFDDRACLRSEPPDQGRRVPPGEVVAQLGVRRKPTGRPRRDPHPLDRLTFGGNIIETGTDSYRLARTRATP